LEASESVDSKYLGCDQLEGLVAVYEEMVRVENRKRLRCYIRWTNVVKKKIDIVAGIVDFSQDFSVCGWSRRSILCRYEP